MSRFRMAWQRERCQPQTKTVRACEDTHDVILVLGELCLVELARLGRAFDLEQQSAERVDASRIGELLL